MRINIHRSNSFWENVKINLWSFEADETFYAINIFNANAYLKNEICSSLCGNLKFLMQNYEIQTNEENTDLSDISHILMNCVIYLVLSDMSKKTSSSLQDVGTIDMRASDMDIELRKDVANDCSRGGHDLHRALERGDEKQSVPLGRIVRDGNKWRRQYQRKTSSYAFLAIETVTADLACTAITD